jgi:hypothetical protein
MIKRFSVLGSIGVVVGAILATWLGPKILGWYFEPPADIGINYRPAIDWAMRRLIWFQIAGIVLGFVGGIVLGFLTRKKEDPRP